jgi:hypothetical protein
MFTEFRRVINDHTADSHPNSTTDRMDMTGVNVPNSIQVQVQQPASKRGM